MNVCVFASASPVEERYRRAALELGLALGKRGWGLVFGGYSNGLMKAVADGFARAGAPITGVETAIFSEEKTAHPSLTQTILTRDLSERKQKMTELSDLFIALPGGIGTLDEMFSVLALRSVGRLSADAVFYNVDGFWDPLLETLRGLQARGFIHDGTGTLWRVACTPEEI